MKKAILWSVAGVVAVAASVFTTISSIDPAPKLTDLQKENLRLLAAEPGIANKINKSGLADFQLLSNKKDGTGGGEDNKCWQDVYKEERKDMCMVGGSYDFRVREASTVYLCWPGDMTEMCFQGRIVMQVSCSGIYSTPTTFGADIFC